MTCACCENMTEHDLQVRKLLEDWSTEQRERVLDANKIDENGQRRKLLSKDGELCSILCARKLDMSYALCIVLTALYCLTITRIHVHFDTTSEQSSQPCCAATDAAHMRMQRKGTSRAVPPMHLLSANTP